MNEKWKKKIRKLLALSLSDNVHEAERAKVQAQKIMAKYGLNNDDIEVVSVPASKCFKRASPKESELTLMQAIDDISGCISHLRTRRTRQYRNLRYKTSVVFMGIQHDAEIAAYCWDVLYSQLVIDQKIKKKECGLNANHIEIYSVTWCESASKKLKNAFGYKPMREGIRGNIEKFLNSDEVGKGGKTLQPSLTGDFHFDKALMEMGRSDGEAANLHTATQNARRDEKRLTAS